MRFTRGSATGGPARVATDRLGRLAEGSHEGAAHAVAVGKARFRCDDVDGMTALLHHQPRGLDTHMLPRLGGGLTGFRTKRAAELAWAQVRGLGDLLDG